MSSFVRQTISKLLLPNLERDLTNTLNRQLVAAHNMADCFLSPSVYAYQARAAGSGAFNATAAPQKRLVKVHYPLPTARGLFE